MLPTRLILSLACMLSAATAAAQTAPEPSERSTPEVQSAPASPTATPTAETSATTPEPKTSPAAQTEPKSDTGSPQALESTPGATPSPDGQAPQALDTQPAAEPKSEAQAPQALDTAPAAEPKSEATATGTPTLTPPVEPQAEVKAPEPRDVQTTAPALPPAEQPKIETKAPPPAEPKKPELAVMTGGGAFAEAYRKTVLEPFAKQNDVTVTATDGAAGDLLLLDALQLDRRCTAGDLMGLESSELLPSAASSSGNSSDFLDGAVKPCGIAPLAWSHLFVFDPAKFDKRAPRAIADILDVRRYPGKRALPMNGRGLAEALLVADGVPAADVYRVLESSDGLNRIIKILKKDLGTHIVWYERLPEAIALLRSGEASIAFTSNGHAFTEQARGGPLGLIWDGQVLHAAYLAIAKSTHSANEAKALVAFASRPEQLTDLVREIPYGPMRRAGISAAEAARHAVTGQELGPFLPTAPDNMRTAVRFDPIWWDANKERMEAALGIARQGPPAPPLPSRP